MKKDHKTKLLLSLILVGAVSWALFAGNGSISPGEILSALFGYGDRVKNVIVFQLRIPRVLAASAAGAALSVSGYLLQNDLDNTLASPGILGINNGAGLFVLLYAWFFPYRYGGKCIAAFLGALLVTAFLYLLTTWTGMSKSSVVLSGVAVSALCLSLVDVIISLKPETVADRVAFQIGGFASLNISSVYFAVPLIAAGLVFAVLTAPSLDLMLLGDEVASGLGLNVRRQRICHIVCAAMLSGAAVSMCGIVGFLGLIVPNVVRIFHHGKSRGGIVSCILLGAAFLLICDTLGRILVFPYELPCGLFLSMIGAPFLVWMLAVKKKRLGIR